MAGVGYSVLLVEDDEDFARLTSLQLTLAGHQVMAVTTMHEGLVHMERSPEEIDIVLLDLGLPDIEGLDGIRAAVRASKLPVIVYTGNDREPLRAAATELGASAYLVKGAVPPETLNAVIREVAADAEQSRLVPTATIRYEPFDGPESSIRASCEFLGLSSGLDCWALVRDVAGSDIVLVRTGTGDELRPGQRIVWAPHLRDADGELSDGLRGEGPITAPADGSARVPSTHSIVVTIPAAKGALIGWSRNADSHPSDHLAEYVTYAARQIATLHELEARCEQATRRADIAGQAAAVDILTGLGNRRSFNRFLRAEEARCQRHGHPGLVVVVDLDELKIVNDREGHSAGDAYLQSAAACMIEAMRSADSVFRIGGDEFAAVAVSCGVDQGPVIEKRLRAVMNDKGIPASVGWAGRPPEPTLLSAYVAADGAMYADKEKRRSSGDEGKQVARS